MSADSYLVYITAKKYNSFPNIEIIEQNVLFSLIHSC